MKRTPHRQEARVDVGFVMAELMLAMVISVMIGVTVLSMLYALGSATDTKHDTRRAIIKRQVAVARVGAQIRGAASVLEQGTAGAIAYAVLWLGDATGDDDPNLSELRRVEWDEDDQAVYAYQAPAGLAPGSDPSYALTSDFDAVTEALKGTASFPRRTVLRQVSDWSMTLDDPVASLARTVELKLKLTHDSGGDEAVVIASLRATPP